MKKILNSKLSIFNSAKGFTIVELLIYMSLLSGFLIVITELFASILNVKLESEATSAVEQDGRYILTRMSYDISKASPISTPGVLGASTSNLIMVISGVVYTYEISGNNLQITNNLGTNNLNSSESNVSNISFQKIGNLGGKETIKISFDLASSTIRNSGAEIRTFKTTIGRR